MDWLPDGTLLVTEKQGRLRIVRGGALDPRPVAGVPDVFTGGQGGLLDVAVHPRFAENRRVYLGLAHGTRDENALRVVSGELRDGALASVKVVLDVTPKKPEGQHFGSRLAWLDDGTLLVSVGDGGNAPARVGGNLARENAQRLGFRYGKVLRVRDDGSIPPDNPFVGTPGADPAVWTLGHRNVQGLVVDRGTGRVWATEHGALGGDELNLLEPGRNYGWPVVTFSLNYGGGKISDERSRPGIVDPRLVWTPCIAPSGLALVTSERYPGLKGDLLAGGLAGKRIRRVKVNAAGLVTGEEELRTGERVRDVRQGPDGFVYVLTDESDGRLLRLTPTAPGRG